MSDSLDETQPHHLREDPMLRTDELLSAFGNLLDEKLKGVAKKSDIDRMKKSLQTQVDLISNAQKSQATQHETEIRQIRAELKTIDDRLRRLET